MHFAPLILVFGKRGWFFGASAWYLREGSGNVWPCFHLSHICCGDGRLGGRSGMVPGELYVALWW